MGSYTIDAQTWLIDDKWQYQRMGMGSNWQRRIPVVVRAGQGPGVAVECLRAVRDGIDQAASVRNWRRWTTIPISSTTVRSSAGAAHPISSRGSSRCVRPIAAVTDPAVKHLIDQIQGNHTSSRPFPVWPRKWPALDGALPAGVGRLPGDSEAKKPPAPPQMGGLAQSQIPQLQAKIQPSVVPPIDAGEPAVVLSAGKD